MKMYIELIQDLLNVKKDVAIAILDVIELEDVDLSEATEEMIKQIAQEAMLYLPLV